MEEKEILVDAILAELDATTQQLIDYAVPLTRGLASLHEARLVRLERMVKQLKKAGSEISPEDASELQKIELAAEETRKLSSRARTVAARQASAPRLKANEWLVSGNVSNHNGNPYIGARVQVFDRDRKYNDLLGDTKTDTQGDFYIIYHDRDFFEFGENQPELFVRVEDSRGRLLYTTEDHIRFNAGRIEYFEIVIEDAGEELQPIAAVKRPRKKR